MKRNNRIEKLEEIARQVRKDIIEMLALAGSGHPGGALSASDIVVALYFSIMKHNPKDPQWKERDRFILSKGHSCPAMYACLARAGYFPVQELKTLRKLGSRLQGHPSKTDGLPGIEVSTGSLGQGLSIANGVALGLRLDKIDARVYCLMGDGEIEEGQIWEAAMAASHYRLDNLCGIVDNNGLQIDGKIDEIMNPNPISEKWKAFGWNIIKIDGNKMVEILEAFAEAKKVKGKPTVIVAKTIKGKGVSFMENAVEWHGKAPSNEQAKVALSDLESS
ncbi:transketolase [bacterium]|nr:transketolase [bacterium]NIN92086.1 transketolase [bacterium]NIO18299.1 transketolase [bacterium]NIO72935.1 transketolase [bacterium]